MIRTLVGLDAGGTGTRAVVVRDGATQERELGAPRLLDCQSSCGPSVRVRFSS